MDANKQQAQPVWPPHSQQTYANPGVNSLPQINAPTSSSPFNPTPSHSPVTFVSDQTFRTVSESSRTTVQGFQNRQYNNERFRISQPQVLEHIAFQSSPGPYPPPSSDGYSTPESRTVAQVSTVTFQPLQQVGIQNYERISPVEDFQEPVPSAEENLAQFETLQPNRTQSLIVTQSVDRSLQPSPNSTIVTGSLFQLGNQIIAHAIVPAEIAMRSPLTQRVLSPDRTIVAIRRDPRESPQDPPLVQQSVLFSQAQSSQRFSPGRPFTSLQFRPLLASSSQLMSSPGGRIQAQVVTIEEPSTSIKVSHVAESSETYIPGAADSTHDDGLDGPSGATRLTQVDSSTWEPSHTLHDLSSTNDLTPDSMAHSTIDSVDVIANGDQLTLTSSSMHDGMDTSVDTTINGVETWATILDEAGRPLGSLRPIRKSMRIASMEQESSPSLRPKYISKPYNPKELWCEDCNTTYETECPKHRLQVMYDRLVLPRAWASLPPQLSIHIVYQSQDQRETLYGVFTKKFIAKRTQFGPFHAELVKLKEHLKNQHFILQIEDENGEVAFLDLSNDNECNWMKLVRPADNIIEQNLVVYQHGTELFYVTIKNIEPKTELRVWYAAHYAERIGTTLHELRQEDIMALEDQQNVWPCFECNKRFNSSAKLQKHLNTHDDHLNRPEDPVKRPKKKATFFRRPKGRPPRKFKGMKQEEYVCQTCQKVFPRNYSLQRHLIMHSGEKKHKCSICDMKFSHVYNRNRHLRRHKARGEMEPMARPFKSLFKKKGKESGGNEWVCTHCDLTFDNSSLLNLHTLTHAAENVGLEEIVHYSIKDGDIDKETIRQELSQDGETSEDGTDLQCPECTQIFDTKAMLIQHASVHGKVAKRSLSKNPGKPFKCDLCYKAFSTEERLQKHMLVHGSEESKPLQCDVCLKRFLNNSALSCHIKIHSDKKYYECPFCKEGFDQIQNLKDHVVIHSINGTYLCPHCQKIFDEYNAVRKHIRAFHSEKRYPCDRCDKIFPRPDKLKLHMLRHSNHREFLCANCGKQFKRKDKLKEHMKRMHSAEREARLALKTPKVTNSKKFIPKVSPTDYHRFIYKCHTCLLGFKRRGMLVNHLAKRHPDVRPESVPELNLPILKTTRDYYCQYCERVYKSSSKRKAHILKNHPGADLPLSNRRKGGIPEVPGIPNPTFSETVGSITTHPHPCGFCHKQYASKAKLLQHQRKKHVELISTTIGTISQVQTTDGEVEITIKRKCSPRPRSRFEEDGTTEVTVVTTTTPQQNESLQAADLLTQAMSELTQSLNEYRSQTGEFQTISPRIAHTGTTTMLPMAVTTQHPHSTIELSHLAPALTHYQTTQQVQVTTQPLSPQSVGNANSSTTYVPRTWASYTNYSSR